MTGNKGGPGAPKGSKRQLLAKAFYDAVSTQDVVAIVKRLITDARQGDSRAARAVLDRFVQKAPQGVELSGELAHKLTGVVHLDFGDLS